MRMTSKAGNSRTFIDVALYATRRPAPGQIEHVPITAMGGLER